MAQDKKNVTRGMFKVSRRVRQLQTCGVRSGVATVGNKSPSAGASDAAAAAAAAAAAGSVASGLTSFASSVTSGQKKSAH